MIKRYVVTYADGGKDIFYGYGSPSHDMNETILNIHTSETNHVLIPWHVILHVSIVEVKP